MKNERKIVLITGGTSGIGLGIIEYLLESNDYEIISLSRSKNKISHAKEILGDNFQKIVFLQGDISNPNDCEYVYKEIFERYKKLDGLVNCAGIIKLGGLESQTINEWNDSIKINLSGTFFYQKPYCHF